MTDNKIISSTTPGAAYASADSIARVTAEPTQGVSPATDTALNTGNGVDTSVTQSTSVTAWPRAETKTAGKAAAKAAKAPAVPFYRQMESRKQTRVSRRGA